MNPKPRCTTWAAVATSRPPPSLSLTHTTWHTEAMSQPRHWRGGLRWREKGRPEESPPPQCLGLWRGAEWEGEGEAGGEPSPPVPRAVCTQRSAHVILARGWLPYAACCTALHTHHMYHCYHCLYRSYHHLYRCTTRRQQRRSHGCPACSCIASIAYCLCLPVCSTALCYTSQRAAMPEPPCCSCSGAACRPAGKETCIKSLRLCTQSASMLPPCRPVHRPLACTCLN